MSDPLRIEFCVTLDSVGPDGCELTGGDMAPVLRFKPEDVAELRKWGSRLYAGFRVVIEEIPEEADDG